MGRHTKPKSPITYLGGRPAEVRKNGVITGMQFSRGGRAVTRQEDRKHIDAISVPPGAVRSATHAKTFRKVGAKGQNGNHHHNSGQSYDLNAAFQAPRRGHGTIELSKRGQGRQLRTEALPSKQHKQRRTDLPKEVKP